MTTEMTARGIGQPRDERDGEEAADATEQLTPELIREVTEKVYRLMQQELRLARQRKGCHSAKIGYSSAIMQRGKI